MTDETLDFLKSWTAKHDADLIGLREEVKDVKDGLAGIRVEIAALGQQVAGLATAVYSGHDRFMEIERRIDRIERRLELSD